MIRKTANIHGLSRIIIIIPEAFVLPVLDNHAVVGGHTRIADHGLNRGYAWVTAPRFCEVDTEITVKP